MPNTKFPPDRLVTRCGLVLPRDRGMRLAEEVFTHYSRSTARVDTLAQLRLAYTPQILGRLILPSALANFRQDGLVRHDASSGAEDALTEKGHVAISMVGIASDGDDVDTWLREPFVDFGVLQTLEVVRDSYELSVDEYRSESAS